MGKIYVVNCTAQYVELNYRPEFSLDNKGNRIDGRNIQAIKHPLQPGQQVVLSRDFTTYQASAVIDQLENFGAAHVNDVRTAKAKGLVRLVYSLDAPVPLPVCKDVADHNQGYLTDDGRERRKRLAVAIDHNMRRLSSIATDGEVDAPKTDVTFELVDSVDESVGDFEEGYKVADSPRSRGRGRSK
jgi:hypothetical protein